MFNIKKAICELFKKPLVEVSLEYTHGEEIPEIGIPAQYFINALKDVDKWEACVETGSNGITVRKLINKETKDVVSFGDIPSRIGVDYNYPGWSWMNYSERKAVEEATLKTYQNIERKKQNVVDEASRQKMFKDYGEYK